MGIPYPKNKYHAKKCNGYDSIAESDLGDYLRLICSQNLISGVTRQHCVSLSEADIRCKIDFRVYDEALMNYVWVEMKGLEIDRWRIIKKLWAFYGPGPLRIFKKNKRGIYLDEEIFPRGAIAAFKFKW
jgi:hypothetical protein